MARQVRGGSEPVPLFTGPRWHCLADVLMLTPRQREVAQLLLAGLTYQGIALRSGLSVNTVRMHMRALFVKLGVHDRVSALLRIFEADRALTTRRPRRLRVKRSSDKMHTASDA